MTAPSLNFFLRVDVTLASADALPVTYSLVNKSLKDDSAPHAYWPVLRSVGEVSLLAGEFLPQATLSSVEVDNNPGTFGFQRKFSDLFQRMNPLDQELAVYLGTCPTSADGPVAWQQLAKTRVNSWGCSYSPGDSSLTLAVEPFKVRDKVLSLEVSRSVSGMESAPASSLGKPVPLLLGTNVDCVPVRVSPDGADQAVYAWGTCLYQHAQNFGLSLQVYTKDLNDRWGPVDNAAYDTTSGLTSDYFDLNKYDQRAHGIGAGGNCLATGVWLVARGNSRISSTARLSVFLLRYEVATLNVVEEVARGLVVLANYNALNAANTASFNVDVSFDKAVYLSSPGAEYAYALGWGIVGWQLDDLSLHAVNQATTLFIQDAQDRPDTTGTSPSSWKVLTSGSDALKLKAKLLTTSYAVTDHVEAATDTGLTWSRLTVSQPAPASGQSPPLLETVPIALGGLQGLSSYGSGVEFTSPVTLVYVLGAQWTGTAWSYGSDWDLATLNSTYETLYDGATPATNSRRVTGVFEGKVTFLDFLTELCRATASRVGVRTSGQCFLYPYGLTQQVVAHVPHADLLPLSWEMRDVSGVVNRVVIRSGRTFLQSAQDYADTEQSKVGYLYANDFSGSTSPALVARTAESRAAFGRHELLDNTYILRTKNNAGTTNFLTGTDAGEGSVVADFLLGRFGRPLVYCSFVVPIHRYNMIEVFDVITFQSTAWPCFYGSDADPQVPSVDTGSGNVVALPDVNGGQELTRSETYRGLVEGKAYVLPSGDAPAIRLTVLVLLNAPYDPT